MIPYSPKEIRKSGRSARVNTLAHAGHVIAQRKRRASISAPSTSHGKPPANRGQSPTGRPTSDAVTRRRMRDAALYDSLISGKDQD